MENIDYWKVLGVAVTAIVAFWFLSLISKKCFNFDFSVNNIVITFVGIVATFVVVGNYAQVKDIERKLEEKIQEVKTFKDEQINIRSHEVDYINTFRLMNVLSQENPYDMKVKCLTFCLSDMNKLDRVKNSAILEEVRKAHEDNVFNNASINILRTFISELSKALNNDSVLLNDITSIYNKKTNNPTQNIPDAPPTPTGE